MPASPQSVHDLRRQWEPHNVRHDNTLARPLRDWSPKERVDVIVTNPPFGGREEDGIEAGQLGEDGVGQHLARPQVAGAAEVVLDRVEGHAGGVERLPGLGDDLGADAVPGQDADRVGQGGICLLQ